MYKFGITILLCIFSCALFAQQIKDKAAFTSEENKYWNKIEEELKNFETKTSEKEKKFKLDASDKGYPTSLDLYSKVWHNPPLSQGNTGTCWSFSTTSFFESEVYRITGKNVKLSEIYTVYWETVEKARGFVQTRGNSLFDEGSEGNAVVRIWKKYGVIPAEAYPGKKSEQPFHSHEAMFTEMKAYLNSIKAANAWNEKQVLETIQAILNHYIGEPPRTVAVDGKTMTPMEYFQSLGIDLDDYVDLISLMQSPYYEMAEYNVPDNWWHSKEYLNVPLDDFIGILKNAVRKNYSVAFGADVSEPGYLIWSKVAVVPTFDIPSEYIDEHARQFRFTNKTTTDDHGIHCIGWFEKDGKDWYVVKDSGSGSRNGKHPGYMFYNEDYVKLKIMNIMVHKDAAQEVLKKYHAKSK